MKSNNIIDLIIVLTQKEMKIRYKSNFLGYLWSILNPLAFAMVYHFAFKIVMRIEMENYTLFLIAGLFPWQAFSNSITASPGIFLGNASFIKKVSFPKQILTVVVLLQDMIHFMLALPVLVFFLLYYHETPSFTWLYGIPLMLVIQFVFTYGICLVVSSINLFIRDLERLTTIFMMLLFFCTPIIYPSHLIPQQYQYLITFNPAATLIISWRSLFIEGRLEPLAMAYSLGYGIAALIIGSIIYKKLSWKFAEVL
jgi:lipopolysaccharide transport system permease protein